MSWGTLEASWCISRNYLSNISKKPLDVDLTVNSVKKIRNLLVVDNCRLTCGASSEIITAVLEKLQEMKITDARFERVGFAKTISQKAVNMLSSKESINWNKINTLISKELEEFKGPF